MPKNNPIEVVFNCNANSFTGVGTFGFTLTKGYFIHDATVKRVRWCLDPTQFVGADINGFSFISKFSSLVSDGGPSNMVGDKSTYFLTGSSKMNHTFPLCSVNDPFIDVLTHDNLDHILIEKQNGLDKFGPFIQFEVGQMKTELDPPPATTYTTSFDKLLMTQDAIGSNSGFIEITLLLDLKRGEVWAE